MRRTLTLAAAAAAALAAPAGAEAATLVWEEPGRLLYTAAPGTAVHLSLGPTWDGAAFAVDSGAGDSVATPPAGCEGGTWYGSNVVTCSGVTAIRADLGDGDDIGQVSQETTIPVTLLAGPGDDLLEASGAASVLDGGDGDDRVIAGAGADELRGGAGADRLEGRGGADRVDGGAGDDLLVPDGAERPAADVVDGGPGVDTVAEDYASRFSDERPPLTITLAGGADDGRPGEGDDLRGVERVVSSVAGSYTGGDGADELRLTQVGGDSSLTGLGGDDRLRGGDGADRIDGGPGDDALDGGFGDDVIVGGPGRDAISADQAGGDCGPLWCKLPYGNDRVEARDGEIDSIACGAGRDVVVADLADVVAPDCEEVQRPGGRPAPGPAPRPTRPAGPVRPARRAARVAVAGGSLRTALARGLVVRLSGLPAGARREVRALAGRRVVASARARADRGGRATVRLRFTAAARRSLRGAARVRLTVRAGGASARVTLAAGRAAASAASAASAERVRTARFRVELTGVQRTRWSVDRRTSEGCDLWTRGEGGETIRFRSRPTTLSATWIGGTRVLFRGRALATLDLAATIARQGSLQSGGEVCSDGDGGGQPPASDCGTKKGRVTVDLSWPVRRSDLIAIRPDFDVPFDPFRTCPAGGLSWPQLLDSQPGSGRLVGAELPIADLFRHGKNIVIARDRAVTDEAGEKATTTIRWELSFTRLR